MIVTANSFFNQTWEQYKARHILPILARHGMEFSMGEGQVFAEVNHGRWIIRCGCGGAEKAWEECIFFCQSCQNTPFKHKFVKATFPKDRKKIEGILLKRPIPNRNWEVGESLDQLKAENEEHKGELL